MQIKLKQFIISKTTPCLIEMDKKIGCRIAERSLSLRIVQCKNNLVIIIKKI